MTASSIDLNALGDQGGMLAPGERESGRVLGAGNRAGRLRDSGSRAGMFSIYHGMQCVMETTDGIGPVRTYAWGLDVAGRVDMADSPFVSMAGAGGVGGLLAASDLSESYCYAYDGNGNVMALVDAAGDVAGEYRYGPYGQTRTATETGIANPFRFSTKFLETAFATENEHLAFGNSLDLYDYGFRWYHAQLGRWTARDPYVTRSSEHRVYDFSFNSPVDRYDVLGFFGNHNGNYPPPDPTKPLGYVQDEVVSLFFSDAVQALAVGTAAGSGRIFYGQTAVRIDGTEYFITGRTPKGFFVPKNTSIIGVFKNGNPRTHWRLDFDRLTINGQKTQLLGWEHNQKGMYNITGCRQNHTPAGWKGQLAGRSLKVLKYGGRALFIVGLIQSGVEVYKAENHYEQAVIEAGGWAGAIAGAWAGGKFGAMGGAAMGTFFAGIGAAPGAAIGGAIGAVGGGIVGFWGGQKITHAVIETVYEPLQESEFVVCCEIRNGAT